MAEEVIALKVSLDAADSANSVRDLKKAIKELENAALEAGNKGDEALSRKYAAAAGAAKDKMADFKKEIQGVSDAGSKLGAIANVGATIASGFQAAQGAAALFGASGKDLEKVMLKVQAATALAQGAQALANATEDIAIAKKVVFTTVTNIANAATKAFGISAAASMALATAGITVLVGAVIGLIAYLSSATSESEKLAEQEKKRKEQALAANKFQEDSQIRAIENELKLAQAEGKSADEILAIRKRLLNAKIDIIKQEEDLLTTTAERARELSLQRQDLENEIAVADAERNRQRVEDAKKTSDEIIKVKKDEVEKLAFKPSELKVDANEEIDTAEGQKIADAQSLNALLASINDDAMLQQTAKEKKMIDEINAYKKQEDEKELSRKKRNSQFALEATRAGLQAISDLVVATAGKSEAAQRRAFNFQKGVNIATTTIDTYLAAQKAYASQIIPADPSSPVRGAIAAGIAITSGLARVAIIARTQFNSGGGSPSTAGGGGESGSISGGGGPSGIPTPATSILGEGGQVTNITGNQNSKVYVTETDISATIKRVNVIEARAKVG